MILRKWMLRALHAERRARLAEDVARAAMKRLSDQQLLDLRAEMSGEGTDESDVGPG